MAGAESIDGMDALLRERVDAVYALAPAMIVMDLLGSVLIAWSYWSAATAAILSTWLTLTVTAQVLRTPLILAYRMGWTRRWSVRACARALTAFALVAGLLWGLVVAWMVMTGTDPQISFVLCVALGGLSLSIANVVYWPVYGAFAIPLVTGAAVGYGCSQAYGHRILAIGAVAMLVALTVTTRRLAHMVLRVYRLAEDNRALAASLAARGRELEEAFVVLQQTSRTDPLTGLANRRSRDARLAVEWERQARTGQPLAVIAIDVDHFKHYNDTHGHDEGDRCLQAVARAIAAAAREPADLAARHGGEEFMLVLPGTSLEAAAAVAERIRVAVAHAQGLDDLPGRVTASFGVASTVPCAKGSLQALLSAADAALYRAKLAGRNRYELAVPHSVPAAA